MGIPNGLALVIALTPLVLERLRGSEEYTLDQVIQKESPKVVIVSDLLS